MSRRNLLIRILQVTVLFAVALAIVAPSFAFDMPALIVKKKAAAGGGGSYVLKDSQESNSDDWHLGYDSTRKYTGTSFNAGSSYTLKRVTILAFKETSATAVLTAYIYDDSSGFPGSVLATSTNTVDGSTLPTSPSWTTPAQFEFSGLSLTSSTRYHIVVSVDVVGTPWVHWNSTNGTLTGFNMTKDDDGTSFATLANNVQGDFRTYAVE